MPEAPVHAPSVLHGVCCEHPSLHGLNGHCNLFESHRLGQAHVRPGPDDFFERVGHRASRNDKDSQVGTTAQDLDQFHAIDARQHQVSDVEIEAVGIGVHQKVLAIGERAHGDALITQIA